jgi:pilus assembly protein CpaE
MAAPKLKSPPASAAEATFLGAVVDETTRETVKGVARQLGWQNPVMREGGVSAAVAYVRASGPPAVLVVDISDSEDPVPGVAALAAMCGSESPIVAIGLTNDVKLYRRLRDAGAADYLVKPVPGEVLAAAVHEAAQPRVKETAQPKLARVIAMMGSRGGVGTTSLAISAGWTMAQQHLKVTLLDLDLHFGSAALSLDLEPGRGLRELLTHPERIDSLLIDAAVTSAGDRLRLLGAEEPLEDPLHLGPEGLVAVIHQLKAAADIVIIDLPRTLGPLSRQALLMADVIGIVTDLSLPAMRDTQRLVTLIKGIHTESKAVIIANRVGGVGGEVAIADFERGVGVKIAHVVPFDRAAAIASAETAKPLVDVARNARTANALRSVAMSLGGTEPAQPPSLFKRVLGR